MAKDHRIYSPLILLLVLLLTSSSASNSRLVRLKRAAPPKSDGIQHIKAYFNNTENKEELVKVTRKFEKGTNSTIKWEGEAADLFCNLTRGKDLPKLNQWKVAWRLNDGNYHLPATLRSNVEHFNYDENTNMTIITIYKVNMSDRGWYQCALYDSYRCPSSLNDLNCIVSTYEIQLRVKNRMDKLYPSVSICVEVVLLFIIIVVYESRKSKTEVEESDTDGSPDQKNVSDTNGEGVSEATRLAKD